MPLQFSIKTETREQLGQLSEMFEVHPVLWILDRMLEEI